MIPTGYHLHQEKFNIRSPFLSYGLAYNVISDGTVDHDNSWGVMGSYGLTFALRTSTATTMCILLTRLKVDMLIFILLQMAFLQFPTGVNSPGLDNFDNIYAHNVDSYGDISNYAKPNNTVTDSCGIK